MTEPWQLIHFDETIFQILLTCALSAFIGLEREYRQKSAGFRTHMLVGLGATMFTLLSVHGFGGADPSRIAAQIVSGIGFIGAGAIMRQGMTIRGLTTASTLWLVASIGMAVGVGWYEPAVVATCVALILLIVLTRLERFLPSLPAAQVVRLRLGVHPDLVIAVRELLAEGGWIIRSGHLEKTAGDLIRLDYTVGRSVGTEHSLQELLVALEQMPGVNELGWDVIAPLP